MAVEARAWITGEYPNQKINFELPSGPKGDKGDPGPWAPTQLNGTPINTTPLSAGLYYQTDNSATIANGYPAETFIGEIISTRINHTRVLYRAYPVNWMIAGNYFYEAGFIDGVLGPWRTYTSTRVDNTAGKAIYQWDPIANREQLIYGDTGWRDMGTFGLDGVTGVFRLCRVGSSVFLMGSITKETSGTTFKAGSIPPGFRPRGMVETLLTQGTGTTLNGKLVAQYSGQVVWYLPPGSVTPSTFEISWRTAEAWPSTLPGTADGTVPNL